MDRLLEHLKHTTMYVRLWVFLWIFDCNKVVLEGDAVGLRLDTRKNLCTHFVLENNVF